MLNYKTKYQYLAIFVEESQIKNLRDNQGLYNATREYLNKFVVAMEKRIEIEKTKQFNENDILKYLREHKEMRMRLKKVFDKNLTFVKEYYPDILKSWKYYQEFLRICEEG